MTFFIFVSLLNRVSTLKENMLIPLRLDPILSGLHLTGKHSVNHKSGPLTKKWWKKHEGAPIHFKSSFPFVIF